MIKMPTSCVPACRYGANAPGWMDGAHPTRLKIDQVDAILFIEQRMINIVIMAEQHC